MIHDMNKQKLRSIAIKIDLSLVHDSFGYFFHKLLSLVSNFTNKGLHNNVNSQNNFIFFLINGHEVKFFESYQRLREGGK